LGVKRGAHRQGWRGEENLRIHILKKCKELPGVAEKEVEDKKRLLAECISYIEKDTGTEYPPVIVSPCLFFSRNGGKVFFGGAATGPIKVRDKALCIVIVSLSTLLNFDKDLILGILAEEFLHYAFFISCWIKGRSLPPKDKDKRHKPELWFKDPYVMRCYNKAQKQKPTPKQFLKIKRDWERKGGPISDGSELRLDKIDKVCIPHDIKRILSEKGLI